MIRHGVPMTERAAHSRIVDHMNGSNKTPMRTIAFYSYKGGTGRSLLLLNTAFFLAEAGQHVVMLDLDLEAPGLHHKLGLLIQRKRPNIPIRREKRRGTDERIGPGSIDMLLDWQLDEEEWKVDEYLYKIEREGFKGSLEVIPAGAGPSSYYAGLLEKLNWRRLNRANKEGLIRSREGVKKLKRDLQSRQDPVDYLLVDARTGVTDASALALYGLAETAVCLFTGTPESVEGSGADHGRTLRSSPTRERCSGLEPRAR